MLLDSVLKEQSLFFEGGVDLDMEISNPFEYIAGAVYESQLIIEQTKLQIIIDEYAYLKTTGQELTFIGEAGVISTIFGGLFKLINNIFQAVCNFFKSIFSKNSETASTVSKTQKEIEKTAKDINSQPTKQPVDTKSTKQPVDTKSNKQPVDTKKTEELQKLQQQKRTLEDQKETVKKRYDGIYREMVDGWEKKLSEYKFDPPIYYRPSGGDCEREIEKVFSAFLSIVSRYNSTVNASCSSIEILCKHGTRDKNGELIEYRERAVERQNERWDDELEDVADSIKGIKDDFSDWAAMHPLLCAGDAKQVAKNFISEKLISTSKLGFSTFINRESINCNQHIALIQKEEVKYFEKTKQALEEIKTNLNKQYESIKHIETTLETHQTLSIAGRSTDESKKTVKLQIANIGKLISAIINISTERLVFIDKTITQALTGFVNANAQTTYRLNAQIQRIAIDKQAYEKQYENKKQQLRNTINDIDIKLKELNQKIKHMS